MIWRPLIPTEQLPMLLSSPHLWHLHFLSRVGVMLPSGCMVSTKPAEHFPLLCRLPCPLPKLGKGNGKQPPVLGQGQQGWAASNEDDQDLQQVAARPPSPRRVPTCQPGARRATESREPVRLKGLSLAPAAGQSPGQHTQHSCRCLQTVTDEPARQREPNVALSGTASAKATGEEHYWCLLVTNPSKQHRALAAGTVCWSSL